MSATILIVEDHALLRELLQGWLEMELPQDCVIEATNSLEAVEVAAVSGPQVVIIDVDTPQRNGLETARRIKAAVPGAYLVVLAFCESQPYRAGAAQIGASAYVPKSRLEAELIPTVKALLDWGET